MEERNGEELLKIAIDRARNSIRHFFSLLDLDPNLFEHLYNLEVIIDRDNSIVERNCCACFKNSNDDFGCKIYVSSEYLDYLFSSILNTSMTRQEAIDDMADTIIHETLHANRSIIVGNTTPSNNVNMNIMGHDREFFDELLMKVINSGTFDIYQRFIPIYKVNTINGICDVVAYDKETSSYNLYANESFEYMKIGSSLDELLSIGLELNSEGFNHTPTFTYPYNNDMLSIIDGAPSIYHQNDEMKDVQEKIELQVRFEDMIIMALTKLVLYTRKSSKLDLEKFYNSLGEETSDSIKFAAQIFYKFGKEGVKWFMLSSYDEVYDDKLYKSFQEDYYRLLDVLAKIEDDEYNKNTDNGQYRRNKKYANKIIERRIN